MNKHTRYFMCARKAAWREPPTAAVKKALVERNVALTFYVCPNCGQYHLTRKGAKQVAGPSLPKPRKRRAKVHRFDPGGSFDRYIAKRSKEAKKARLAAKKAQTNPSPDRRRS